MKPMVSENFSTCSATSRSRRTSRALSSVVRPRSVRRRRAVWVARRTFSVVCTICAPESRVSVPAVATSAAWWVSCSESRASALTRLAAWAAPWLARRADAATSWLEAWISSVVAVGVVVHAGIRVTYTPKAHQLPGVIQRDQDLRAGRFPAGLDHLLGRESVRHDWPPSPHGFAGESGIGVEANLVGAAMARRGVRDELHFVRPRVVAREAHVLPWNQPPGQLLNPWEALRQTDVPRDRLRQALNERELVGVNTPPDDRHARDRGAHEHDADDEKPDHVDARVCEGEAGEGQTHRAGVHDGLPPRGERGVHPGEGAPECERDVEGAVHDAGQEDAECDEGHEVARGERLRTRCPAEPGIREPRQGRARREVRGDAERRRHGQTAQDRKST